MSVEYLSIYLRNSHSSLFKYVDVFPLISIANIYSIHFSCQFFFEEIFFFNLWIIRKIYFTPSDRFTILYVKKNSYCTYTANQRLNKKHLMKSTTNFLCYKYLPNKIQHVINFNDISTKN